MICPTGKAENFFEMDWTGGIALKRLGKFAGARKSDVTKLIIAQKAQNNDQLSPPQKRGAQRERNCAHRDAAAWR
jgi:hypothetical protein